MKTAYLDDDTRSRLIAYIRPRLTEKRLKHTFGTEKMAIKLAEACGESAAAAQTAALLHDAYKCISSEDRKTLLEKYGIADMAIDGFDIDLVHGYIAACAVREDLGIIDEDILNAIRYHTTGRPGMSRLEKIIYSSDVVEENRVYDVADYLRKSVLEDIDRGTYIVMNHVLRFLLENDSPVYALTVDAYNALLKEYKKTEGKSG